MKGMNSKQRVKKGKPEPDVTLRHFQTASPPASSQSYKVPSVPNYTQSTVTNTIGNMAI